MSEYMVKGFVMDDERLKNPDGRPDYFDEMLARIRDIRASEKRFYQKIRDLFALSSDYDTTDKATQMEQLALTEYEQFDARRKVYEAQLADRQDEEELKQLETQIKKRQQEQE